LYLCTLKIEKRLDAQARQLYFPDNGAHPSRDSGDGSAYHYQYACHEYLQRGGHLLRVLLIKERLQMVPFGYTGRKLSSTQNHAWFIWDKNYKNPVPSEIVVRRINLIEGKAFAIQNGIELDD
jgi:hypothetical protein